MSQDENRLVQKPLMEMVRVPGNLRGADLVEIRVTLTPFRRADYLAPDSSERPHKFTPAGEQVVARGSIDRWLLLDVKDHRAIFHVVRELLFLLVREYLKMDL